MEFLGVECELKKFLKFHLNTPLVFQLEGNPFLIGRPNVIEDDVAIVVETGYTTYLRIREIESLSTIV
ncbi:Hypothetical protein LUCI_4343 [Lucifera butyrica]|uniref:Uncharacterized protein n=1 Tax=Lucifera butyrica TaxID=1351585 RepID=A0A498RDQ0_9FIRM|nr:hypothetical protein [Lucifera butyrica]VBB09057.1 Hypothetical protein LUCI_4343 [Lucifera butyrica]